MKEGKCKRVEEAKERGSVEEGKERGSVEEGKDGSVNKK